MDAVPLELRDALASGQCIAFLGAGFSMPDVPGWLPLLKTISDQLPADRHALRDAVHARMPPPEGDARWATYVPPNALELEAIAESLRDAFTPSTFLKMVGDALPPTAIKTRQRLEALQNLPFKGVVTTNFDRFLDGSPPGAGGFRNLFLLGGQHALHNVAEGRKFRPERVLKLHGDAQKPVHNPIVFSRRQYRARVHGEAPYTAFLKVLLATHPVLFLGVSFTDAYLNELRSEILSWMPTTEKGHYTERPRWWAVMPDLTPVMAKFFDEHECIKTISYATTDGGRGHGKFDLWMSELVRVCSPEAGVARLVAQWNSPTEPHRGARILWVDDHHTNNERLITALRAEKVHLALAPGVPEALEHLDSEPPYDLIVTKWGRGPSHDPMHNIYFDPLVRGLHERTHPPVLVFASGHDAARRRYYVRQRGGLDYVHEWQDLFRWFHELFESEDKRRERWGYSRQDPSVTG